MDGNGNPRLGPSIWQFRHSSSRPAGKPRAAGGPADHNAMAMADGIARDCGVRQYFQNKILEIFLNPISISTRDPD